MQLEVLERNKLTGAELLSRIQLLESRVDAATATGTAAGIACGRDGSSGSNVHSSGGGDACGISSCNNSSSDSNSQAAAGSFSPFAQAKMAKQLSVLEQQAAGLQATTAQLTFRADQVRSAPLVLYGTTYDGR